MDDHQEGFKAAWSKTQAALRKLQRLFGRSDHRVCRNGCRTFEAPQSRQTHSILRRMMQKLGSGRSRTQSVANQMHWYKRDPKLIETAIFTGSSPSAATTSTTKINVQMLDANLNGRMDSISYIDPSGGTHRIQEPFDEMSLLLWDTALAMTFRVGKCCR